MLILVFVLMIIYRIQYPNPKYRLTHKIPWIYAILSMGYIIFWAGVRTGYMDTANYILTFDVTDTGKTAFFNAIEDEGKGPGWNCLMVAFKSLISTNSQNWLFFIALASGIPIMLTLRNKSCNYLYSVFIFIAGITFIWMFNGIRQFLAAAIAFGACSWLVDRKLIGFIGITLLCATIHSTALLLLPAYFIVNDKVLGWKIFLFTIFIAIVALMIAPIMEMMEEAMANTVYSGNMEEARNLEDDGVSPYRVMLEAIPVILSFIKRKEIELANNKLIIIAVNMSMISLGIYFVGMFSSGVMIGRLPIYFSMYNLILLPYLFSYIYSRQKIAAYAGYSILMLAFYFIVTNAMHFYYISTVIGIVDIA